jgi:hypothetical protein
MSFNPELATFSFFMFFIGTILTVLTYSQHEKLSLKCVNKLVQGGMNTLIILSTMIMVVPIVQLVCYWGCNHPQKDLWYRGIIISISTLIIITGSVVLSGLKCDCDTKSVKDFIISLIVAGFIIIIIVGILPFFIPKTNKSFSESYTDYYSDEEKKYVSVNNSSIISF